MIRYILIFILLVLLYMAVKTVIRSAFSTPHNDTSKKVNRGEEMVLDPNCNTYVPRSRATARRIAGRSIHFCSESCARAYEDRNRE